MLYTVPFVLLYFSCIKTADPYPEKVGLLSPKTRNGIAIPHLIVMITVFVKECNKFSQSFYDSVVNSLQLHRLTCSCGHAACLSIHGYYTRSVKLPQGKISIRICRLCCAECGVTHAILLSSIVPYSQMSLSDQRQICLCYETYGSISDICDTNPSIDENNVKSVRRAYRSRWREMLRSFGISLRSISELIRLCFSNYSMQLMQIHRGTNLFFEPTT